MYPAHGSHIRRSFAPLGEATMGEVRRAPDAPLGRGDATKELPEEFAEDACEPSRLFEIIVRNRQSTGQIAAGGKA